MEEFWGRSPNRFQNEVMPTILQMLSNDLPPEALILAQPTESGKSSIAFLMCGNIKILLGSR